MILDILENAQLYIALNLGFEKAFAFLSRSDLTELKTGKYEIDGNRVFAMVSMDSGRSKEDSRLEIHQKYIDIQLVIEGNDDMGWKPLALCKKPCGQYDSESDIQFFDDEPELWLAVKNGTYAIFFPDDAHMPLISSSRIHKVVVKIAVDQLVND